MDRSCRVQVRMRTRGIERAALASAAGTCIRMLPCFAHEVVLLLAVLEHNRHVSSWHDGIPRLRCSSPVQHRCACRGRACARRVSVQRALFSVSIGNAPRAVAPQCARNSGSRSMIAVTRSAQTLATPFTRLAPDVMRWIGDYRGRSSTRSESTRPGAMSSANIQLGHWPDPVPHAPPPERPQQGGCAASPWS